MTNREILEVICDMANALQIIPRSRQGQAIEELIDKLQKPTVQPVPCDDAISRQQAQAKLKEICDRFNYQYDDKFGDGTSGYAFVHAFDDLLSVQPKKGEWIPISSINEIPKEGAYWVTFEYKNGYRETSHIGWDTFHKHWDDEEGWALDDGDYIIAYMPYFEPKPYNPKGEQ